MEKKLIIIIKETKEKGGVKIETEYVGDKGLLKNFSISILRDLISKL